MKFNDFSRTFTSKFKNLLYQIIKTYCIKSFIVLYINSAMSFTRFASGEKSSLRFCFQTLSHREFFIRLRQTTHFDYFSQLKVNLTFCPFQDFYGLQPKFNDFPGPGIFFGQFQDFPEFSRTVATLTDF